VPEVRVKGHTQQVPPPHLKFMYTIILPGPAQPRTFTLKKKITINIRKSPVILKRH